MAYGLTNQWNRIEDKNRTVYMGYLVHDKYRFSKLSDGETDYSTDWIRITSYVLRKKSWTLTFLNKINSK